MFCSIIARYWDGRIVTVGDPANTVVGRCTVCKKQVCSNCTFKVNLAAKTSSG